MSKVTPFLWFDRHAEEAARFYAETFPDSSLDRVHRSPGGDDGDVLMVEFTVLGLRCAGMNAGPAFPFTEAFSFQVETESQAETDRYWAALTADGGSESKCGWCKDRFGLSWQITPRTLMRLIVDTSDPAGSKRAFEAMMTMRKIDIDTIEAAYAGRSTA